MKVTGAGGGEKNHSEFLIALELKSDWALLSLSQVQADCIQAEVLQGPLCKIWPDLQFYIGDKLPMNTLIKVHTGITVLMCIYKNKTILL